MMNISKTIKEVTWPKGKEVGFFFLASLGMIVFLALYFYGSDFLLIRLFEWIAQFL